MRDTVIEMVPHLADRFTVVSASDTERWNAPVGDRPTADATLYGLLAAGDELGADALLELAVAGGMHRDADMLYCDEIRPSPVTGEREPFLKPDFSPGPAVFHELSWPGLGGDRRLAGANRRDACRPTSPR